MLPSQRLIAKLHESNRHGTAERVRRWLAGRPGGSVVAEVGGKFRAFPDLAAAERELDREELLEQCK